MRIIYADSVFALNFAVDYLLLLAAGKICSLPLHRWRMALGAFWGGAYALLSILCPPVFALATVKILAGGITAAIAFLGLGPFPRTAVCFFAVAAAFGGAVQAASGLAGGTPLSLSLRSLVLAFALCYAALSLVFRGSARHAHREIHELRLTLRGRETTFRALRDTGCELRDSREMPVLAAEWAAVAPLFPELSESDLSDPAAAMLKMSALPDMAGRCGLISCLTAAGDGLLLSFRHDSISIDGEKSPHARTAIVRGPLSPGGDYQALF